MVPMCHSIQVYSSTQSNAYTQDHLTMAHSVSHSWPTSYNTNTLYVWALYANLIILLLNIIYNHIYVQK